MRVQVSMKRMRDEVAHRCERREILPAKARASYRVEAELPRGSLSTSDTSLRCGYSGRHVGRQTIETGARRGERSTTLLVPR
jgi:hypothetical protein